MLAQVSRLCHYHCSCRSSKTCLHACASERARSYTQRATYRGGFSIACSSSRQRGEYWYSTIRAETTHSFSFLLNASNTVQPAMLASEHVQEPCRCLSVLTCICQLVFQWWCHARAHMPEPSIGRSTQTGAWWRKWTAGRAFASLLFMLLLFRNTSIRRD